MKSSLKFITIITLNILAFNTSIAQNVGVATDSPDAPFHVFSSGQVQTPGGLLLLGNRSEVHLELDFNKIQSSFSLMGNPIPLLLQPEGGKIGIGTNSPEGKVHIFNSGQIYTPGGLLFLGNKSEMHLEMDFNKIQSQVGNEGIPTSLLIQPNGGKVGIGTNNPQSSLHVEGTDDQMITLHNTAGGIGKVGLDLLRGDSNGSNDWRVINDGGIFKVLVNTDNFETAGTETMKISTTGKVTFGPASPVSRLNVNGPNNLGVSSYGDLTIGDSQNENVSFDDNEIYCRDGELPATLRLQYYGGNLSLCNNNDGKVGIGTSNPESKLHIKGGTDLSLASGGQIVLGSTTGANIGLDNNEIMARNNGATAPLYFQADGGDVLLIPNEGGQIGIGITSPNFLPTGYMLAVDGKIISEEVRVEMSGAWPDYVFEEDYELTPLKELENQINEKGHLPGIPSASDVEANGFELGDMQKRMMEKIEELTLYLIEANKKIERLEQLLDK